LVANLFTSLGVEAGRISAEFALEPILFTIEKAIPLGLIVNELVSNALKHAFPGGRCGKVRIGLHGRLEGKSLVQEPDTGPLYRVHVCELTVADNGVGLPSEKAPEQERTLGMKLVSMLARQLQAELKVRTGPGTEFHLVLSVLPAGANDAQAIKKEGPHHGQSQDPDRRG
jgi:two-component sensor histidine kinase